MTQQRLDYLVAKKLGVSRARALKLIQDDKVRTADNSLVNKPSQKFSENVDLIIDYEENPIIKNIELKVIFENEDCVVIDKPTGVLTHSKGAFNEEDTVADWLKDRLQGFEEDNNRAGIVHRLDRSTSGIMICAKNPQSMSYLQKQFSQRKVKKIYYALIENELEIPAAIIDIPIARNPKDPKRFRASKNGKSAQTAYSQLKTFKANDKSYSLIELIPQTGRTHQIRVHMLYLKHPIVGDDFYGGAKADRLYLHAASLEITLPGGTRKIFTSDLPAGFIDPKIIL